MSRFDVTPTDNRTYTQDIRPCNPLGHARIVDKSCLRCGRYLNAVRVKRGDVLCGNCDETPGPRHNVPGGNWAVYLDGEVDFGD